MLIIYTILIACAAVAFSSIITAKFQVLNGLHDYLERTLPKYLFFPLIGCHKCVAGQWALWLYLFYFHGIINYDPVIHIWFILQTIFNAALINDLCMRAKKTTGPIKKTIADPPELLTLKKQHGTT